MEEKSLEEENLPKSITIKGYQLSYKAPPLKGNIFRLRCRRVRCKYFIKINEENIKKIINNQKDISFTEINEHTNHRNKSIIVET